MPATNSLAPMAPIATYRIQLSPDFGFDAAAKVLPYLKALGVSHVYLSPYLASTPSSSHGYDVVDPTQVRKELGGEAARKRFVTRMQELGLEQMIDVVPNHLGIDSEHNRYFWDVLEHGEQSRFLHMFDVDWGAHADRKLVLPILPLPVEQCIHSELLTIRERDGELCAFVGTRPLPLSPETFKRHTRAELNLLTKTSEGIKGLLEEQHYRLVYFRTGLKDVNYRRFLDISSLAATSVDDPRVFAELHDKLLSWVRDGSVSAIRVDHPDGLTDPEGYFLTLRKAAPQAWIVAEKITAPGEALPETWPVDGTTGYELLRLLTGMFVLPEGLVALESVYASFVKRSLPDFATLLYDCKRHALTELLVPEVNRVMKALERLLGSVAQEALVELVARMEVGRTYGRPGEHLSLRDRCDLQATLLSAIDHRPDLEGQLGSIVELLSTQPVGEACLRFQQLSAAAHAKGLEDTAFYRYARLLAVNEIGLDPSAPLPRLSDFHRILRKNRDAQPQSLLCTTTHDTKRGEDTRLRIAALSEVPDAWHQAVQEWSGLLAPYRGELLDRETEYFLLQTLVGVWPISEERFLGYAQKAVREARRETNWLEPNVAYEKAVVHYITQAFQHPGFIASMEAFIAPVVRAAQTHALTQTLVKLTAPGVPDIYQGADLWDLSLVDPDNRRPVDYAQRAGLLETLKGTVQPEQVLARADEGLTKLWVLERGLMARKKYAESLAPTAPYEPLIADDDPYETVLAYMRGQDVIVVTPRFTLKHARARGLPTLQIPAGTWRNLFTSEQVKPGTVGVSDLLARFPVALLVREATVTK